MKYPITITVLLIMPFLLSAQTDSITRTDFSNTDLYGVLKNQTNIPTIYLNKEISTHFITKEDIKYVDISTNNVVGDIPLRNILRAKPIIDTVENLGTLTIITERKISQYKLVYSDKAQAVSEYYVHDDDELSYINKNIKVTYEQIVRYAQTMYFNKETYYDVSTYSNQKLRFTLNNIYTIDNLFFIDLSLLNQTKIKYDIDQIRFKIEDKKQTKATNFQQIEVKPIFEHLDIKEFKYEYRNIFVFEKFTFPDEKVLTIEISEKQISGRTIILRIDYIDIVNARYFNPRTLKSL